MCLKVTATLHGAVKCVGWKILCKNPITTVSDFTSPFMDNHWRYNEIMHARRKKSAGLIASLAWDLTDEVIHAFPTFHEAERFLVWAKTVGDWGGWSAIRRYGEIVKVYGNITCIGIFKTDVGDNSFDQIGFSDCKVIHESARVYPTLVKIKNGQYALNIIRRRHI